MPPRQEICAFSYDPSHVLRHDDSSLRYYYPPELGVPLSRGADAFRKASEDVDGHLDGLLSALARLEQDRAARKLRRGGGPMQDSGEEVLGAGPEDEVLAADFVTWRGMMTKVRRRCSSAPRRCSWCLRDIAVLTAVGD